MTTLLHWRLGNKLDTRQSFDRFINQCRELVNVLLVVILMVFETTRFGPSNSEVLTLWKKLTILDRNLGCFSPSSGKYITQTNEQDIYY